MIRINLIPHREAFRQQQIIEHITVFFVVLVSTIALLAAIDAWKTQDLVSLQDEKLSLQSRNTALTKKIGELKNLDALRQDVERKLAIVDELQAGRFRTLITLKALAEAIPESIWVKKLSEKGGTLSLAGFGESSQGVAAFMRALEKQDAFSNVQLQFDNSVDKDGIEVRSFELTFSRVTVETGEAEKGALTNEFRCFEFRCLAANYSIPTA